MSASTDRATSTRAYRASVLALVVLSATLLLAGNGSSSVFDRDEARFALAVREMRERHDLVLPSNFGEPRYHKPILAYWLALGSERLLGPGEFAWRLPSVLCGLVTLGATLALARRRFGPRVAWRAGAILATTLVFLVEDKILTADAPLLAATTLSFWAWSELREGSPAPRAWQLLFWATVALGLLAKGVNVAFLGATAVACELLGGAAGSAARTRAVLLVLAAGSVAAALPGVGFLGPLVLVGVALFVLVRGSRPAAIRAWSTSGATWGMPLCAALVAVWLVPALLRTNGAFLTEGVGHHLLARTSVPFEGHAGFPGYYLATGLVAFFPWAAWLPAALRGAWRDPRCGFFLAWILGPWVLIECLASKLPHYALVTLPAVAVLVAREWERRSVGPVEPSRRWRALESALFALPCLCLAAGALVLAQRLGGALVPWALVVAVLALGLAGSVLSAGFRRAFAAELALAAGGAVALYAVLLLGLLPALEPRRPSKPIGAALARVARAGETIHLVRYAPASLGCYLPAGHAVVQDSAAVTRALEQGSPGLFVAPAEVGAGLLEGSARGRSGLWEKLETVRGLDGLRERELWILRRATGGSASETGVESADPPRR